ncbi:hypothetical protein DVA67_011220 [Solirubrobacter sp. CPCC 204708]|uniref:Secreted protein n=1 Tax=Solirubrobacter deserti TaxID=2282478 RepID=A0ABT4RHQ7_9ACTN|nr:hypothetical protein [Solirubrobacter deserti]MBE2316549.1 hypothetical protein [Solirubrobacter deserti]MDA0138083.1 hypothetical protein [Solirubrobacter deserti]
MKRLLGLVVALSLLPVGTAAATGGRSDMRIVDNRLFTVVDGPGFVVGLTQFGLYTHIDDRRFGIPSAGYDIVRDEQTLPTTVPAIQCDNGTYTLAAPAAFKRVIRNSAPGPRPAPYPAAFGFPFIFTFVGTLDAEVVNQNGERFRLLMSDLAHEELDPGRSFTSTNPIHAYIVDARGRVRDRASLVGRVSVDLRTGQAKHNIVDEGTCHQTATRFGQPGVTVFGPFFVLPFPTTVIRR